MQAPVRQSFVKPQGLRNRQVSSIRMNSPVLTSCTLVSGPIECRLFFTVAALTGGAVGIGNRPTPARQVVCDISLGEYQGFLERATEILLNEFSLDPAPQKLPHKNSAEGDRLLGESPCAPELAGDGS